MERVVLHWNQTRKAGAMLARFYQKMEGNGLNHQNSPCFK